jgi:hypothetical protein
MSQVGSELTIPVSWRLKSTRVAAPHVHCGRPGCSFTALHSRSKQYDVAMSSVFCNVMPCSLEDINSLSKEPITSIFRMKAAVFSPETSLNLYQCVPCCIFLVAACRASDSTDNFDFHSVTCHSSRFQPNGQAFCCRQSMLLWEWWGQGAWRNLGGRWDDRMLLVKCDMMLQWRGFVKTLMNLGF